MTAGDDPIGVFIFSLLQGIIVIGIVTTLCVVCYRRGISEWRVTHILCGGILE